MNDPEPTTEGFAEATPHELAFHAGLTAMLAEERCGGAARRLVEGALREWERGYRARGVLFVTSGDADARLAAIRAGLLDDLAALASDDGLPLPALLGLGDASPDGWLVAVRSALEQADGARCRKRHVRAPRRARSYVDSWEEATRVLVHDEDAVASGLESVRFCDGDAHLLVSKPTAWDREQGWRNGRGPAIGLRYQRDGGFEVQWCDVDREVWSTASALIAALHLAPRAGLTPAAEALARNAVRVALGHLAGARVTPREAIASVLAELGRMTWPRRGLAGRAERWRWPMTFGTLIGAIDRCAGPGGGYPGPVLAPGTWVEVFDGENPAVARGAGWLIDPPVLEQRRTWLVRLGVVSIRPPAKLSAYVRIDGVDERVEYAKVRLPRRVFLFG